MRIGEIRALLNDIESDRVERTISTTNTDKFGQAICAFANDLPDYKQAGYLFLGVKDDGEVQGLDVTDDEIEEDRKEGHTVKDKNGHGNGHKNGHEDDQKPSKKNVKNEGF